MAVRQVKSRRKAGAKPAPKKTQPPTPAASTPVVTPAWVQTYLRSRFNPLRNLTPELLSFYLDRFKLGWLRECALVWDTIQERDDKITLVAALRRKGISRYGYQIELVDDLEPADQARAEEHKAALQQFYSRISVTNAIDENEEGTIELLIKQMMNAVAMKYSVHEIVWQPQADGALTAQFRWVPLWFFENTTGQLRYLPTEGLLNGNPLEPGEWMVTAGDGLMIAASIAYMFKSLPLRDWVTYCESFGMPGRIGKTNAAPGTPQWEAMMQAVRDFASDFAAVMNNSDSIETVDLKGSQANLPYEPLAKRMDAAIAALFRGGDLSTKSSGQHEQGRGSQRQEDEAEIILDDDVVMINGTLRIKVDRYVIQNVFGDDRPLARFAIVVPPKEATAQDIAVDEFLVTNGCPLGVDDTYKRYGRTAPQKGEPVLTPPPTAEPIAPQGLANIRAAARMSIARSGDAFLSKLVIQSKPEIAAALANTFAGVRAHFKNACSVPDAELPGSLQRFKDALPSLLEHMNVDPPTAAKLAGVYAPALVDGLLNPTQRA